MSSNRRSNRERVRDIGWNADFDCLYCKKGSCSWWYEEEHKTRPPPDVGIWSTRRVMRTMRGNKSLSWSNGSSFERFCCIAKSCDTLTCSAQKGTAKSIKQKLAVSFFLVFAFDVILVWGMLMMESMWQQRIVCTASTMVGDATMEMHDGTNGWKMDNITTE